MSNKRYINDLQVQGKAKERKRFKDLFQEHCFDAFITPPPALDDLPLNHVKQEQWRKDACGFYGVESSELLFDDNNGLEYLIKTVGGSILIAITKASKMFSLNFLLHITSSGCEEWYSIENGKVSVCDD